MLDNNGINEEPFLSIHFNLHLKMWQTKREKGENRKVKNAHANSHTRDAMFVCFYCIACYRYFLLFRIYRWWCSMQAYRRQLVHLHSAYVHLQMRSCSRRLSPAPPPLVFDFCKFCISFPVLFAQFLFGSFSSIRCIHVSNHQYFYKSWLNIVFQEWKKKNSRIEQTNMSQVHIHIVRAQRFVQFVFFLLLFRLMLLKCYFQPKQPITDKWQMTELYTNINFYVLYTCMHMYVYVWLCYVLFRWISHSLCLIENIYKNTETPTSTNEGEKCKHILYTIFCT